MSSQHKPHGREPPLQKADWTAWTLHLIFGGVVGLAIGWLIAMRLMKVDLIGDAQLVLTILATALILAGLSSHFGERLYGMIPSVFSPEAPPRSHRSWLASCAVTSMGALLLVAMLGWHLDETAGDYHREPDAIGIIMAPFILGLPVLIIYALREGRLLTIYGVIDRWEDPLWYFIGTIGYGIAWLGLILAIFRV